MPSRRRGYPARIAIPMVSVVVLAVSVFVAPSTALAFGSYRLDQRVNSLTQQTVTDSFASKNAIGNAFASVALTDLQTSFNDGISSGAISWVLEMLDLGDVTGTNNGTFHIGFVNGTPASSTNAYHGTSDLDWWYAPDLLDVDAGGVPLRQLTGTFTAHALASSGAHIRIKSAFGQTWSLSSVVLDAHAGLPTTPTAAAGYQPPGFPASEHIDPTLMSAPSMSSGQLKGNVSAASLSAEPIPTSLVGSSACNQAYSASNSMLDVIVGGCTHLIITQVKSTQPDESDPAASAAGAGAPYTLIENGSHAVTTCHDKSAATVTLATCLNAAAYSDYMTFTTDRVIGKVGQGINFTSTAPANAAPGGTYDVTASGGGSGNPVTFSIAGSSTPGACSISGNHVSFLAGGHCTVLADQAGDADHLVAAEASQSIAIATPRESVTHAAPATPGSRAVHAQPAASPLPSPTSRVGQFSPPPSTRPAAQPAKTVSGWLIARFTRLRL